MARVTVANKLIAGTTLLILTVTQTLSTEASRNEDGTYHYNTFLVPLYAEVLKLSYTLCVLGVRRVSRPAELSRRPLLTVASFVKHGLPGFCYFVSNNCAFYVIQSLGPTQFQILNNLKLPVTALLMRMFLARTLSMKQWKALIILVIGATLTRLGDVQSGRGGSVAVTGYLALVLQTLCSAVGGVYSERLLKRDEGGSIHLSNAQLYVFGVAFGYIGAARSTSGMSENHFNACVYIIIFTCASTGLLVSFILKYLDNIAKAYIITSSMVVVALFTSLESGRIPLNIVLSIILTGVSIDQYYGGD